MVGSHGHGSERGLLIKQESHAALIAPLDEVDLDAFARSPGFLGYCEGDPTVLRLPAELGRAWREVKEHLGPYDGLAHQLERSGLRNEKQRTTDLADTIVTTGASVGSWRVSRGELSPELEFGVLQNCMLDGLGGPCFFIWLDRGLVLYPHNDIGIGVIATDRGPDTNEFGREALRRFSSACGLHVELRDE